MQLDIVSIDSSHFTNSDADVLAMLFYSADLGEHTGTGFAVENGFYGRIRAAGATR